MHLFVGRFKEALEFYDQALAGTKNSEDQSILLNNKCAALMGMKDYEKALSVSSKTIQLRPNWSKAWYRAGRILFEKKSYTSALN